MNFFRVNVMFGKKEKIVIILIAFVIAMVLSAKGVLMKVLAGIIAGIIVYKYLRDNHII